VYSRATTSAMADLCALPAGFFPLDDISVESQNSLFKMQMLAAAGNTHWKWCRGLS
jgi:hypothetical protein